METPEQQQEQLESARAVDQQILDAQEAKTQAETVAQEKEGKKIGTMFFFILLILCIIGDIIDIITVGTIGWLVGLFIDAILLMSMGVSKGGRKQFKRMIIGVIGDSIPIVNILPFRSGFLIWSYIKSRA